LSVSDLIFTAESEYIFKYFIKIKFCETIIQDVRCRLRYSYMKKLNLKSITILEKMHNCPPPKLLRPSYITVSFESFRTFSYTSLLRFCCRGLMANYFTRGRFVRWIFYFFLRFLWGNFYLVFLTVPIIKLHTHKNTFFSFMVNALSKEIKRKQNNTD